MSCPDLWRHIVDTSGFGVGVQMCWLHTREKFPPWRDSFSATYHMPHPTATLLPCPTLLPYSYLCSVGDLLLKICSFRC